MIRKILVLMLACLAALFMVELALRVAAWHVRAPVQSPSGRSETIVCLGDSFTYGWGASRGESYPAQLERMLAVILPGKYAVVNEGIPGQSSSQIQRRAASVIEKFRPRWVILLTGNNNDRDNLADSNIFLFLPGWRGWRARFNAYFSRLKIVHLARVATSRRSSGKAADRPSGSDAVYISSNSLFRSALERGCRYAEAGDFKTAGKFWQEAARLDPHDHEATRLVSISQQSQHQDDAALRTLEAGLRDVPDDERLWRELLNIAVRADNIKMTQRALRGLSALKTPESQTYQDLLRYGLPDQSAGTVWTRLLLYNITRIVITARNNGCLIALMNYPLQENASVKRLAQDLKVPFIDLNAAFIRLMGSPGFRKKDHFVPDGHCSARGYEIIAAEVRDFILSADNGRPRSRR